MPFSPNNSHRDRLDQSACRNHLLAALPPQSFERLSLHLQPVDLSLGQVLHEPRETINTVYFPNQALVSLVQTMEDGSTIEAGIVGQNGLVSYAAYLGGGYTTSRAIVQIAGTAIALDAAVLRAEFEHHRPLRNLLLRYSQAFIAQLSQTAACNRFHIAEERLARWLLQSQDALESPHLELTQDFLSSMLGTRRASVTLAAGRLQQAGLICYTRGHIEILDRKGLEATACECYEVVRAEYLRLLRPPDPP